MQVPAPRRVLGARRDAQLRRPLGVAGERWRPHRCRRPPAAPGVHRAGRGPRSPALGGPCSRRSPTPRLTGPPSHWPVRLERCRCPSAKASVPCCTWIGGTPATGCSRVPSSTAVTRTRGGVVRCAAHPHVHIDERRAATDRCPAGSARDRSASGRSRSHCSASCASPASRPAKCTAPWRPRIPLQPRRAELEAAAARMADRSVHAVCAPVQVRAEFLHGRPGLVPGETHLAQLERAVELRPARAAPPGRHTEDRAAPACRW